MSDGLFYGYLGALALSAMVLAAVAARGSGRRPLTRVAFAVAAAGFAGYGGYLLVAAPPSVTVFPYAFVLPGFALVSQVRSGRRGPVPASVPYAADPGPGQPGFGMQPPGATGFPPAPAFPAPPTAPPPFAPPPFAPPPVTAPPFTPPPVTAPPFTPPPFPDSAAHPAMPSGLTAHHGSGYPMPAARPSGLPSAGSPQPSAVPSYPASALPPTRSGTGFTAPGPYAAFPPVQVDLTDHLVWPQPVAGTPPHDHAPGSPRQPLGRGRHVGHPHIAQSSVAETPTAHSAHAEMSALPPSVQPSLAPPFVAERSPAFTGSTPHLPRRTQPARPEQVLSQPVHAEPHPLQSTLAQPVGAEPAPRSASAETDTAPSTLGQPGPPRPIVPEPAQTQPIRMEPSRPEPYFTQPAASGRPEPAAVPRAQTRPAFVEPETVSPSLGRPSPAESSLSQSLPAERSPLQPTLVHSFLTGHTDAESRPVFAKPGLAQPSAAGPAPAPAALDAWQDRPTLERPAFERGVFEQPTAELPVVVRTYRGQAPVSGGTYPTLVSRTTLGGNGYPAWAGQADRPTHGFPRVVGRAGVPGGGHPASG